MSGEVVMTIQIKLGEFKSKTAGLGTYHFPISLDKQFAFE